MNLETSLVTQLTNAYLQKTGSDLPPWITQGTGLYVAAKSGDSDYFKSLPEVASEALTRVSKPAAAPAGGMPTSIPATTT